MGKANFGYKAADGKVTSMTLNTPAVDEVSFAEIEGYIAALDSALDTIVVSTSKQATLSEALAGNAYDPAGVGGVRGEKAIIRWFAASEGPSGQFGSNEIGAVDRGEFTLVNGRYLLQGAAYTALKAAFDDLAKTENGADVSVYECEYVTRTL